MRMAFVRSVMRASSSAGLTLNSSSTPVGTGTKVGISAALVVAAEGTFVISALVLGKEVVSRYRGSLDPRAWFRKR